MREEERKESDKKEVSEFEKKILGIYEEDLERERERDKKLNQIIPSFVYNLSGVHTATVNVVRFSPNGQFLATGSDDIFSKLHFFILYTFFYFS